MNYKAIFTLIGITAVLCYSVTPKDAAERWSKFSGGKSAKLVYGNGGKIYILDLSAGTSKSIGNYASPKTKHGISVSYRWSPNGKRILLQNADNVAVINEDGSNLKTIATHHQCGDLIWSDWRDDNSVVYSTGTSKTVVLTKINTDNSAGSITTIVSQPSKGECYSSVSIDGNWLAYNDFFGNIPTKGVHRPLKKNISDLANPPRTLIPDNSDMCQLVMVPDGKGTSVGQVWTHLDPGTLHDANGKIAGSLPRIGTIPQRAFSWSNELEYFLQQGENTSLFWVWIRSWSKRSSSANIQIADGGDVMYYPDLWVGSSKPNAISNAPYSRPERLSLSELASLSNVELYSLSGSKINHTSAKNIQFGIYQLKDNNPLSNVKNRFVLIDN